VPLMPVQPGVCPFDGPALPGLVRGLVALWAMSRHAAAGEFVVGLLRVIPGVEVDGDVVRERAEVVEFSSVGASSGESCRYTGASTRPSGMPRPSTMSDRFMPRGVMNGS
jgi:hypothetical protein